MDSTATYRDLRRRTTELLRAEPAEVADRPVPCCPAWTVHDVVAHLAGVVGDALAGNLSGAGTDPWTEAQVDARVDHSLDRLLDDWEEQGSALEAALGPGGAPAQLVFDAATHEQDLRSALHRPGGEGDSVAVAMEFVASNLPAATSGSGLPELRIEPTDGGPAIAIGSGSPQGSVRGTQLELLRCWTGRRSLDQIRGLDWDGDPEVWLPAFTWGPFRVPAAAVEAE